MSRLPQTSVPFGVADSVSPSMTAIAFIEDDESYRSLLETIFAKHGQFTVAGAFDSAKAALQGLPRRGADIVLVDLQLPGHSGVAAIKRLHRRWPHTRCVVLSSSEEDADLFAALAAGASGYLLKTESRQQLLAAMDELLAGGVPLSRSVARRVMHSFIRTSPTHTDRTAMTIREREIMDELGAGTTSKEIAHKLGISPATVKNHLYRIYGKLGVGSRTEAVVKWLRGEEGGKLKS